MKRAVITGITGQDGSYLADLLLEKGYEVHGIVRRSSSENFERIGHLAGQITLHQADLLDQLSLIEVIQQVRPAEFYNLAAQSFVPTSWKQPVLTAEFTAVGVTRVLEKVAELFVKHAGRVPTAELNRFLAELREARQPPSRGSRRLNLLYGAQVESRPPRFRFTVNDPSLVTRDYGYWVENQLRDRFELQGVPVSIDFVRRS